MNDLETDAESRKLRGRNKKLQAELNKLKDKLKLAKDVENEKISLEKRYLPFPLFCLLI